MDGDTGRQETGHGLIERIEALEAEVAAQRELLRGLGRVEERRVESSEGFGSRWEWPSLDLGERYGHLIRAEWWLTRGGVVLLLLGLVFLFKLSVDEGWITPSIRVLFGVVLGIGLVAGGLGIYARRSVVGQAMIGGGIAALYASGFASASLFSLVPVVIAFPLMVAVTVGAFSLAIRQDAASLAVIGAVGGLATPFLLYSGDGSVVGLVLYIALVFTGAAAVYLYRGWVVLLAPAAAGALLSVLAAFAGTFPLEPSGAAALLAGIAYCGVVACSVPALRSAVLSIRYTASPPPVVAVGGVFAVSVASVSLFGVVAEFGARQNGAALLCVAATGGVCAWLLQRSSWFRDQRVIYAYLAGAVGVAVPGLGLALPAWVFFISLSLVAAGLLFVAKRYSDALARIFGHAGFGFLACWFAVELAVRHSFAYEGHLPGTMLLATMLGIGVTFAVGAKLLPKDVRTVYLIGVHVAVLAWLFAAISPLPNGGMLTTIAWGTYGACLLMVSLRADLGLAFNVAIATLVLVAAKLFVADLFWVEAIYRVLLFLGVGGMFLALGYYLRSIWKPRLDAAMPDDDSGSL